MATNRDKHVPCVYRLILSPFLFFSLVLCYASRQKEHDEHGKYRKCPKLDMFQQGRVNDVVSPPKFTNWRQCYFHSAPEVGILQYQKHADSAYTHLEGSSISRNNRKKHTVHWIFNHHLFILPKVEVYQFIQWLKWETNPLLPQRCKFFLQPTHQPTCKVPIDHNIITWIFCSETLLGYESCKYWMPLVFLGIPMRELQYSTHYK